MGSLIPSAPSIERASGLAASLVMLLAISIAGCSSENHPPLALDRTLELLEDETASGVVSAQDEEGDRLSFAVVEAPRYGMLDLDGATGAFTYRPVQDFNGTDRFRFLATDGRAASADATVLLNVKSVNDAPVASPDFLIMLGDESQVLKTEVAQLLEDGYATGWVSATDVDGDRVTYEVIEGPLHGALVLDSVTGSFTYRPERDFNGPDQFRFVASDGHARSEPATVSFDIVPVNDPPELPQLPDLTNSAETLQSFIALPTRDVDGDSLTYQVVSSDPDVAGVFVDAAGTLVVTPRARGQTAIAVTVTDGVFDVAGGFLFTVTDVTKVRRFDILVPEEQAITISNRSETSVTFDLRHNGALLAVNSDALVREVRGLPEERPGEPFDRKLWRFLRDRLYWTVPITGEPWQHDPVLLLNSIGFGFCDDYAAAYVALARQAGYLARERDLSGHVVPEVQVGGDWRVYDPTLGTYYEGPDGQVVGVAELETDPTLVTSPRAPLGTSYQTWLGYSALVADLYATWEDNRIWEGAVPGGDVTLSLPAGARITYPGIWAPPPSRPFGFPPAAVTAELRLDLPAGFTGPVQLPLQLWDVQGDGRVQLEGIEYQVGDSELGSHFRALGGAVYGLTVLETNGISLVFLLNPLRFGIRSATEVTVQSLGAWALEVRLVEAAASARVPYASPDQVWRPWE